MLCPKCQVKVKTVEVRQRLNFVYRRYCCPNCKHVFSGRERETVDPPVKVDITVRPAQVVYRLPTYDEIPKNTVLDAVLFRLLT